MNPFFNSSIVLLVPAFLLSLWAQYNVKTTFNKYSRVSTRKGATAAEVASMLLNRARLLSVPVNRVTGHLSDHYDPVRMSVNLSDSVYESNSIASLGVAAHECGHAIQHSSGYSPLTIRNAIVPIVNLSSTLAMPLFFIGLLLSAAGFMLLGIILFTGVIIFHLVTLPVERNASYRALNMLRDTGALSQGELECAGEVLRAAEWTYIAATVMAVAQLVRLLVLKNQRR